MPDLFPSSNNSEVRLASTGQHSQGSGMYDHTLLSQLTNVNKIMWICPMVTPTFLLEEHFLVLQQLNFCLSMQAMYILVNLNAFWSWSSNQWRLLKGQPCWSMPEVTQKPLHSTAKNFSWLPVVPKNSVLLNRVKDTAFSQGRKCRYSLNKWDAENLCTPEILWNPAY